VPMAGAVRGHVHVHVSVMHTAHTCRCWSGWSGSRLEISRRCDIGRRPVSGHARRLIGTGSYRIAIGAPGHRRFAPRWETVLRHSQRRSTREERGNYRETFQGDHGHSPKRIRLRSPVALDSDAKPPVHDGLVCSDVIANGTTRPDLADDLGRPIDKKWLYLFSGSSVGFPTHARDNLAAPSAPVSASHRPTWQLAACMIGSHAERQSPLAHAANSKATARGSSKSAMASTNQCMTFSSSSPKSAAR
jgi:hypothetical protein